MARVNHKLVKQRLNEKRSSITDRQFFSSRILAGHFEDIATAQTKRYKYNRRVRVNLYWNSKDGSIACTNNEFIRINCGNKFVTKTKGRENRYNIVAGLFAHELGHVLYTDFLGEQTHTNAFAGHYWYPATPILKISSDKMNERAIWDYIAADEKNLEMVQFIVRHIQNIIEDGYIENRMLANFPGTLKYGLECVRKKHFESMDTVTQMIEYEDNGDAHICESILQIILSYAKFGEIKYGDEPLTDERIKIVFSLLSDIDRALLGTSSKERFDVTNTILIRCWDYIHSYNKEQEAHTRWTRCPVNALKVNALDKASPLYVNTSAFASEVTSDAIEDTTENLGLAMEVDGKNYPIRDTAYKSLLDRAKISGNSLAKLERKVLAKVLNSCYKLYSADALLLIRDEKVSAVHSGDASDYSILPIPELLDALKTKLDARFPGNSFVTGYADHSFTSAEWTMPAQKEDLLGAYAKVLAAQGKGTFASKIVPGIRFITSDTGVASAKVSALLVGGQYPIHIGGCVAVDHRHQSKIADFDASLDQLFAQFGDSVAKLQKLMEVTLSYPVNAMTRICKKLSLPKKAAVEAISMYEMACGNGPATAHDVFMAMQEIPFIAKSSGVPEGKMLTIEENMARALSLRWEDYDLAKAVDY